jgi:DNA primase
MKSKGAPSQFTVSNRDKILYPAAKFTKADVVDYYLRVAPFLLPHFQDRPVTSKDELVRQYRDVTATR